jgi:hypothetical protein
MSRFTQNLVLALCGAITSALTAAILVFIELKWNIAIYSFTAWVVLPAGAMLAGMAASSGYYFGARLLNFRPAKDLLVGIVAISTGTFFFIYWLEWVFLTVDGKPISEAIPYSDYLTYMITHTSVSLLHGGLNNSLDLGSGGGYVYAALQIIGFAVGGFCIYVYLVGLPYCKECRLFLKDKGKQTRFFGNSDDVTVSTENFLAKANEHRFQDSIKGHYETGSDKPATGEIAFCSSVELKRCKGCEKHYLEFEVKRWVNKEWKAIPELTYATYMMERVEVVKSLAPQS